jgi:hypothetical protein
MTTQLIVSDIMKYDLTDKMRMAPRMRFGPRNTHSIHILLECTLLDIVTNQRHSNNQND